MNKVISKTGKPCYVDVTLESKFSADNFHEVPMLDIGEDSDKQWALHTNLGSLTVLDRMTGVGWRDIETGFRDTEGKFWLASGLKDVRTSGSRTIGEAIEWVKAYANNCVGE